MCNWYLAADTWDVSLLEEDSKIDMLEHITKQAYYRHGRLLLHAKNITISTIYRQTSLFQ